MPPTPPTGYDGAYYHEITVPAAKVDGALVGFTVLVQHPAENNPEWGSDTGHIDASGHALRYASSAGSLYDYDREYWWRGTDDAIAYVHVGPMDLSAVADNLFYEWYQAAGDDGQDKPAAYDAHHVAVFHLNEDGGPYVDALGNVTDGETGNDPNQTEGPYCRAQNFESASTESIIIVNEASLDPGRNEDFTYELWAKPDAIGVDENFLNKWDLVDDGYWLGQRAASSTWYVLLEFDNTIVEMKDAAAGMSSLTAAQWQHLAVSVDRDGSAYAYLNGVLDASKSVAVGAAANMENGVSLKLGGYAGYWSDAAIADVRVAVDEARSAAWHHLTYLQVSAPDTTVVIGEEQQVGGGEIAATIAAVGPVAQAAALAGAGRSATIAATGPNPIASVIVTSPAEEPTWTLTLPAVRLTLQIDEPLALAGPIEQPLRLTRTILET